MVFYFVIEYFLRFIFTVHVVRRVRVSTQPVRASVDKERDRRVFDGFDSRRSTKILKLKNMETIAFIFFAVITLLVLLLGSFVIAWLFVIIGDGWEYRNEK